MRQAAFPKSILREKWELGSYEADEHMHSGRWSEHRRMIFKDATGKFYACEYSQGLTESQDEYAFDLQPEIMMCVEVELVEVVKKEWRAIP